MTDKNIIRIVAGIIGFVVFLIVFSILNPIVIIGAGERGVVFNNTNGIQKDIWGEGLHLRLPFFQSVHKVSVQVKTIELDLTSGSKDNQTVTYKASVNYHINPLAVNQFYQQLGTQDMKVFIDQFVQQDIKTAEAGFSAEETLTKQREIRDIAFKLLTEDVKQYNLIIDSVAVKDQDFTQQYNKAVEDKAQAKQQAEQAGYLKVQAEAKAAADIASASGSAQAAITTATGQAQSTVITAKAQSEAQQLLQQSLTPQLLQKLMIEKWSGNYPTTMLGGTVPLLQLPN